MTRTRRIAIAVPAALAAVLAARITWLAREPQEIPGEMAGPVSLLVKSGWQLAPRHPLRCREPAPHVHFRAPGGCLTAVLAGDGRVRLR